MNTAAIIQFLRQQLPSLQAIYLFGSRAQGNADTTSDADIAVLTQEKADPVRLFELAGSLADITGCDVDLIDLRGASTVMQYQIITTGQRLWTRDSHAALYESFILSEKTTLDEARAGLIADIRESGVVYGR
jgi:predicted nucleotidyltransferase